MRPESVLLDYIELELEDFRKPVDEKTLREQYELEKDSFGFSTRHRVSHILFEDGGEVAVADRIAQVRAGLAEGRSFAELATEYSDDIGSAGNGGDLGYTSGDAFPTEMEEAIAALDVAVVSEPVETDAGTHLLLVTAREEGEAPSFEDVRPELEETLQLTEARTELLRNVEELRNLTFNSDGLEGPARELGLEVSQSDPVTRDQAQGLFANASLTQAAFSVDVLDEGHNSDVIELAGDHWVALRVRAHNPASVRPLEEVRDEVVATLTEERALAALSEVAAAAVAELRAGDSIEEYANRHGYEWQVELGAQRNNPVVPRPVLQRAFQLPAPEASGSLVDFVNSPVGDALVFELLRVQPGAYANLAPAEKTAAESTGEQ